MVAEMKFKMAKFAGFFWGGGDTLKSFNFSRGHFSNVNIFVISLFNWPLGQKVVPQIFERWSSNRINRGNDIMCKGVFFFCFILHQTIFVGKLLAHNQWEVCVNTIAGLDF